MSTLNLLISSSSLELTAVPSAILSNGPGGDRAQGPQASGAPKEPVR